MKFTTPRYFATDALRLELLRLRAQGQPLYRIARRANLSPSGLANIVHGARPAYPDDQRIQTLCRLLDLSFEVAFESAPEQGA